MIGSGWLAALLSCAGTIGLTSSIARGDAPAASPWHWNGQLGIELDADRERFGAGCGSDLFLDPNGEISEVPLRFRMDETRTSGVLELGLRRDAHSSVQLRGRVKSSGSRTRGEAEVGVRSPTSFGIFSFQDVLELQGGSASTLADQTNRAVLTADRPNLLAGVGLQLRLRDEESEPTVDSLRALFAYRIFRPEVMLTRAAGNWGELALRGSLARRWGESDSTAYRRQRTELELFRPIGLDGWEWRGTLRFDHRAYLVADSLSPGLEEKGAEIEVCLPLGGAASLRLGQELSDLQYSIDSSIYADHRSAVSRLGGEWRPGQDGQLDLAPLVLSSELRYERLRHERVDPRDQDGWSLAFRASRGDAASTWIEPGVEIGLRDYRASIPCRELSLEGVDLSSTSSDYRFLRGSLLSDAPLPVGLRASLLLQYERELHDRVEDDLTLWIVNVSLSRSF